MQARATSFISQNFHFSAQLTQLFVFCYILLELYCNLFIEFVFWRKMEAPKVKGPNNFKKQKSADSLNNNIKKPIFKDYLPLEELQRGLKNGELIKVC